MKTSNFSKNFSLRAIENMARIAATEAEIKKTLQHDEPRRVYKRKPQKSQESNFERQVKAFRKALTSTLPAEEYQVKLDTKRRNAGKEIITVYKAGEKQFSTMYCLYKGSPENDKLESIAVYGDEATQRCTAINKSGAIYGFPIRYATIEIGRRPFVDVHLA